MRKIIDYLADRLHSIYNVTINELKYIFHDTGVLIFFFAVPLGYPVLYAFIYDGETVRDVPVAVVDNTANAQTREFLRMVDATPDVHIAYYSPDMDHAKELLAQKKAYGIVYIPSDFSKNISKGEKAYVSLYADMSSLLFYKAMLIALTDVSLDMGREIEARNMSGLTLRQEQTSTMPIENQWFAMYNPQSGFAGFLIPAILILVIQQTLLLGVGMLAGTARQNNKTHTLVPLDADYKGTFRVVLGKSMAYLMVYTVMTAYLIEIIPAIFSLPNIGHIWTKILFLLPYLFACIFFAMFCSTLIKGREAPMMIFVFTSLPLLFISGVSWPAAAVPEFWKYVGWLFPSTHGIQGFIKINTMNASIFEVSYEYVS
ncbi:MAG: ABC transporter permease, partial [Flavobacteriales bacterium]|nr:ABC transporter permease [Flavobacteriales bacterium]